MTVYLDPEVGDTINEFHEFAADAFAKLNREFAADSLGREFPDDDFTASFQESEAVGEPGAETRRGTSGEGVPKPSF